jgi:hypothetical protein
VPLLHLIGLSVILGLIFRVVLLLEVRDASRTKASGLALGGGVGVPRDSREGVESAEVNRFGTMVTEGRFVFHNRDKYGGCGMDCKFILLPLYYAVGATGKGVIQLVKGLPSVPHHKGKGFTVKAVSRKVRPATLARGLGEVGVEGVAPLGGILIKGTEGVDRNKFFCDLVFHTPLL